MSCCVSCNIEIPSLICDIELPCIDIDIDNIYIKVVEGEHYQGSYYVLPTADGFELATKDKIMDENLSVLPIPYQEVENPQGGLTVSIAS